MLRAFRGYYKLAQLKVILELLGRLVSCQKPAVASETYFQFSTSFSCMVFVYTARSQLLECASCSSLSTLVWKRSVINLKINEEKR